MCAFICILFHQLNQKVCPKVLNMLYYLYRLKQMKNISVFTNRAIKLFFTRIDRYYNFYNLSFICTLFFNIKLSCLLNLKLIQCFMFGLFVNRTHEPTQKFLLKKESSFIIMTSTHRSKPHHNI